MGLPGGNKGGLVVTIALWLGALGLLAHLLDTVFSTMSHAKNEHVAFNVSGGSWIFVGVGFLCYGGAYFWRARPMYEKFRDRLPVAMLVLALLVMMQQVLTSSPLAYGAHDIVMSAVAFALALLPLLEKKAPSADPSDASESSDDSDPMHGVVPPLGGDEDDD